MFFPVPPSVSWSRHCAVRVQRVRPVPAGGPLYAGQESHQRLRSGAPGTAHGAGKPPTISLKCE